MFQNEMKMKERTLKKNTHTKSCSLRGFSVNESEIEREVLAEKFWTVQMSETMETE